MMLIYSLVSCTQTIHWTIHCPLTCQESPSLSLEQNVAWQESECVENVVQEKISVSKSDIDWELAKFRKQPRSDKFKKNWAAEGFWKLATQDHLQSMPVENGKLLLTGSDPDLCHQLVFNSGQGVQCHTLLTPMPLQGRNSLGVPHPRVAPQARGTFTAWGLCQSVITHRKAGKRPAEPQTCNPRVCTKD